MKIKKYQTGGISYLPTTNRREQAAQTGAASSESVGKVPGFTKEIIDLVKENGIETDVNVFLNRVGNILDMSSDPTGEHLTMREILKIQKLANSVKQNHAAYQTAEKSLEEQDAWGDVAITAGGSIYAQDRETRELKTLHPVEYLKNQDKYAVLTNADLMHLRRTNPGMSFNNAILDNLSSAVGMKTIVDYVQGIIEKFGTTTITGYSEKQSNAIRSGLEHIVSGDIGNYKGVMQGGPNGVYKISQEATIVDTGVEAALQYLIRTLPNAYKNALTAKAAAEGYDDRAMLFQMLVINSDRKITADYDKQASEERAGRSGNTGSSSAVVQHTLAESYVDGENLGVPQRLQIAPEESTSSLYVYAQNAGPVWLNNGDKPGDVMPKVNLSQLFETAYGVRNDTSNTVVFGDQLIDIDQIGGIMYDKSDMYRVVMPAKTINGGRDIVPDFELQEELNKLTESKMDPATINRYLQELCPGAKYNEQTKSVELPSNKKHVFLAFKGVAADNYVDFNKDSKYLVQATTNPEVYMNATTYGLANPGKSDGKRTEGGASLNGWFKTSRTKNHLYTGMVFIPISGNIAGTMRYNQEYNSRDAYTNITGRAIEHDRSRQISDEFNSGTRSTNW